MGLAAHAAYLELSHEVESRFSSGETVAGRYRIVRLLGRGHTTELYEARDELLATAIALKTIAVGAASDQAVARLKIEASLARRVTHPNVCRAFDLAFHESPDVDTARLPVLTMELLVGESLKARLRRQRRLPAREAAAVSRQLAAALDAAHAAGVVHGDLDSGNVMLEPDPGHDTRVVVTGLGAAGPAPREHDVAALEALQAALSPRWWS